MTTLQRMALGSGALNWINTGANLLNAGANAYSSLKNNNTGSNAGGETVHNTTIVERQLTPEEIKILQERHAQDVQNQELNRALKFQENADKRRLLEGAYQTPKEDNTMLYMVGGILLLGVVFVAVKSKK